MEFREVTELIPGTRFTKLVCGTKYRIVVRKRDGYVIFQGFYSHIYQDYLYVFNSLRYGPQLVKYENGFSHFYVPNFQKERIQSNMEHRAVNLILRNITGDPTFTWVGVSPLQPHNINNFNNCNNGVVGSLQGRCGTVGSALNGHPTGWVHVLGRLVIIGRTKPCFGIDYNLVCIRIEVSGPPTKCTIGNNVMIGTTH